MNKLLNISKPHSYHKKHPACLNTHTNILQYLFLPLLCIRGTHLSKFLHQSVYLLCFTGQLKTRALHEAADGCIDWTVREREVVDICVHHSLVQLALAAEEIPELLLGEILRRPQEGCYGDRRGVDVAQGYHVIDPLEWFYVEESNSLHVEGKEKIEILSGDCCDKEESTPLFFFFFLHDLPQLHLDGMQSFSFFLQQRMTDLANPPAAKGNGRACLIYFPYSQAEKQQERKKISYLLLISSTSRSTTILLHLTKQIRRCEGKL